MGVQKTNCFATLHSDPKAATRPEPKHTSPSSSTTVSRASTPTPGPRIPVNGLSTDMLKKPVNKMQWTKPVGLGIVNIVTSPQADAMPQDTVDDSHSTVQGWSDADSHDGEEIENDNAPFEGLSDTYGIDGANPENDDALSTTQQHGSDADSDHVEESQNVKSSTGLSPDINDFSLSTDKERWSASFFPSQGKSGVDGDDRNEPEKSQQDGSNAEGHDGEESKRKDSLSTSQQNRRDADIEDGEEPQNVHGSTELSQDINDFTLGTDQEECLARF
jgi:hypothetical protein